MHRGPFLAGEDAPWALSMRERLRSRVLSFVSRAGRRLESDGLTEAALDCYRRALEVDDLAEDLHRGVIRCLIRLGREAEAVACYQRLCGLLGAALGVQPSAATRGLMSPPPAGIDR